MRVKERSRERRTLEWNFSVEKKAGTWEREGMPIVYTHPRSASRSFAPVLAARGNTRGNRHDRRTDFRKIEFEKADVSLGERFPHSVKLILSTLCERGKDSKERAIANERVAHNARNESTRRDSRRMLSRQRSRYCPAVEYSLMDPPGAPQARV